MNLAHSSQRRQDISPDRSPSPITPPYTDSLFFPPIDFDHNAYSSHLPPALEISYCDPSSDDYYIDSSRQSTPYDYSAASFSDSPFMNSFTQNPRLRVQPSTQNSSSPANNTPPPMSDGSYNPPLTWNNFTDQYYLNPQGQQTHNSNSANFRSHKRFSSESSVASGGPDSPYTQSSIYPHIVDVDGQSAQSPHQELLDGALSHTAHLAKSLYGLGNPHAQPFINPTFEPFDPSAGNAVSMMNGEQAMRQAMSGQGNSNAGGGPDSRRPYRGGYDVSAEMRSTPKFDRTVSDAYQDELYNPQLATMSQQSQGPRTASQGSLLSPSYGSVMNERLREANSARSASPTRECSPFRNNSEFATQPFAHHNPNTPATRINSAAQMREQAKLQADAQAYLAHHPQALPAFQEAPTTISPKELLDEYESDHEGPIAAGPRIKAEADFGAVTSVQTHFSQGNADEATPEQTYPSMATSRRQSSNPSSSQQSATNYTFMPPNVGAPPQTQYAFMGQVRRQSNSLRSPSDPVHDFPPSLPSMESTKSDSAGHESIRPPVFSSQESSNQSPPRRPSDTTANAGTYTCATLNCTSRFDTSAKLQKHRREAHRVSPSHQIPTKPSNSATSSASMQQPSNPQASTNNASRNNAPGPHKCEKLNPSTGKPCNTVFSRSYDLTRHEDTIHNNLKQKVRCHMCVEKSFSRNDALTRHMRVVHPEVDFPGKVRRRGG